MITAILFRFPDVSFILRTLLLCALMVASPFIVASLLPLIVTAFIAAAPAILCVLCIVAFAYVTYPK